MDFLQKLDFLMEKYGLNKLTLSQNSGIPYSTVVGWYKKGYEGLKLTTLRKLSDYFNTVLDYWINEDEIDPNYWKTNGFIVNGDEMGHIQKYRLLDHFGQKAVDDLLETEYQRNIEKQQGDTDEENSDIIQFSVTEYDEPMSAGTGQPAGYGYGNNLLLTKEPPRGTSYVAPIAGDSMEPTYHDGDKLFVQACYSIEIGEIGVFFMDGQQWVKELGEGVLLSHNPKYAPRPMTDDIRCQGRVLGVCDERYL